MVKILVLSYESHCKKRMQHVVQGNTYYSYSKCFVDQEDILYAFLYTSFSHNCSIHKSNNSEKYPPVGYLTKVVDKL